MHCIRWMARPSLCSLKVTAEDHLTACSPYSPASARLKLPQTLGNIQVVPHLKCSKRTTRQAVNHQLLSLILHKSIGSCSRDLGKPIPRLPCEPMLNCSNGSHATEDNRALDDGSCIFTGRVCMKGWRCDGSLALPATLQQVIWIDARHSKIKHQAVRGSALLTR